MRVTVRPAHRHTVLIAVVTLAAASVLGSQMTIEVSPNAYTPEELRAAAARSDLIVAGTFQLGWPMPWFDGWHYWPALQIKKVLAGESAAQSISFAWQRPYGVNHTFCSDLFDVDGKSGIWFLQKLSGEWRLGGRRADFCDEPFVAPETAEVEDLIRGSKPQFASATAK